MIVSPALVDRSLMMLHTKNRERASCDFGPCTAQEASWA